MVAFLILGLAMVRLMTNVTSLIAKNTVAKDLEDEFSEGKAKKLEKKYDCADVEFYWVHSIFVFIAFFAIIVFWWNTYPLNNLTYFPDENWSLFSYLLFLAVPFLMFMLCDVVAPQNHAGHHVDLKKYYYRYHKIILGIAWLIQVALIGNLFVFFQAELLTIKVIGRIVLLGVMAPMVISNNDRIHQIGMSVFFSGFIYTIIKYHIYT